MAPLWITLTAAFYAQSAADCVLPENRVGRNHERTFGEAGELRCLESWSPDIGFSSVFLEQGGTP
jgi:hypothetical protein